MSIKQVLSNPVIGDKVFGFLHLKDLKSAALVCRDFKTFLDCRKFWRQAEIRIRQDVLSSDRIQNIGNFVVERKTGVEALLVLLRFLLDKSEDCVLEHIRFVFTNLSPLTIPTLASAVCTVREVSFKTSVLSTSQVQEVMTSVSLSPRLVVRKLKWVSGAGRPQEGDSPHRPSQCIVHFLSPTPASSQVSNYPRHCRPLFIINY